MLSAILDLTVIFVAAVLLIIVWAIAFRNSGTQ
jgi:hypothetical protein